MVSETVISMHNNKKEPVLLLTELSAWSKQYKKKVVLWKCAICSLYTQVVKNWPFSHSAWKYKHACSMWSEEGWFWLSAGSRRAFSPLLSGASVSSATVLSNKPALSTSRVPCLKAPLPNNTVTLRENKENSQARLLVFMPSSLYQIPVLSSISKCY